MKIAFDSMRSFLGQCFRTQFVIFLPRQDDTANWSNEFVNCIEQNSLGEISIQPFLKFALGILRS